MKFGLIYDYVSWPTGEFDHQGALKLALTAEKLGFDSFVLGEEHHSRVFGMPSSPLTWLASIASSTSRIRLGTGILILPVYDPVHLAEQTAALDIISGGRFFLGLGLGNYDEYRYFGTSWKRLGARMEEGVELLKMFWTQDRVTFHGEVYNYDDLIVAPKPKQKPRPKLYLGGEKEVGIGRAARLSDGWYIGTPTTLSRLKEMKKVFEDARRMEDGKGEILANRVLYIAKDNDTAFEEARPHVERLARYYLRYGIMKDGKFVPAITSRDLDNDDPAIKNFHEDRYIIGGPDECISQIERYGREVGVGDIFLRLKLPGMKPDRVLRAAEMVAQRVIPHFQDK